MVSNMGNKRNHNEKTKGGKNCRCKCIYLQKYNLLAALYGKLWEKSEILQHLSRASSSLHCETTSHLELHRCIFACSWQLHSNCGMYFLLWPKLQQEILIVKCIVSYIYIYMKQQSLIIFIRHWDWSSKTITWHPWQKMLE